MNAIIVSELGTQPELRDRPAPLPGTGETLVRVHASSVNPIDGAIAAGMLKDVIPHEVPLTLGRDFAGVVEQVGDGVSGLDAGDEVFGIVPMAGARGVHDGAWAEQIVASEQTLVRKPDGVNMDAAGAAGLAGVTALALIDALELSAGDAVLIVGATGGVGSIAIQLAVAAGASVIAPARAEDESFLQDLGVSDIVDRDGDVVAAVRERHPDGVDAIIDNASNGATGVYDGALKDGGRVASPTQAAGEGPGRTNVMAQPSAKHLARIAQHLADGTVKIPIQRSYDLAQAGEALQALGAGHTQGKLAIRTDSAR